MQSHLGRRSFAYLCTIILYIYACYFLNILCICVVPTHIVVCSSNKWYYMHSIFIWPITYTSVHPITSAPYSLLRAFQLISHSFIDCFMVIRGQYNVRIYVFCNRVIFFPVSNSYCFFLDLNMHILLYDYYIAGMPLFYMHAYICICIACHELYYTNICRCRPF